MDCLVPLLLIVLDDWRNIRWLPRPHDDGAIGGELDFFHGIFRSRSCSEYAANNALMMEHFAFRHGSPTPLKTRERAETL